MLRLVAPEDRAKLGRAGMTRAEAFAKFTVDTERKLHHLIDSYLRQRGIEPIRSRMDKRSTINVGAPDFMFAYRGKAIAMEVKLPGEKLTKEQESMRAIMTSPVNGWHYCVVHDVDEALMELQCLDCIEAE
jgi:hypothetical protein